MSEYDAHEMVPRPMTPFGQCCAVCGGMLVECVRCHAHIPLAAFGQTLCEECIIIGPL